MYRARRVSGSSWVFVSACSLLLAVGCGSISTTKPPTALTLTLQSTPIVLPQDGSTVQVPVTITSPSAIVQVSFASLPSLVQATYSHPGFGPSGTLSFSASSATPTGTYMGTVTVTSGVQSVSS